MAVASWGGYLALVKAGVSQGVTTPDFLVLRYVVAGILAIPLLGWHITEVGEIGVFRGLTLALVAGPVFYIISVTGFTFAPLSHGSVIQPSIVTVGGVLCGAIFLQEQMSFRRVCGVIAVLIGVAMVTGLRWNGFAGDSWVGDLCFAVAGSMWLTFTLLLKHWNVHPIAGTALVNLISGALVVPTFFLTSELDDLMRIPTEVLVTQAIVQGLMSGVVAVVGYAYAVRQLGTSRAAIFTALVPASAMVIGIPTTAEIPSAVQIAGLCSSTAGLALVLSGKDHSAARR